METFSVPQIRKSRLVKVGANVASLSRLPLALACAANTLSAASRPKQVWSNILLEATDAEGKIAKKYGKAFPAGSIDSLGGLACGLKGYLDGSNTLTGFLSDINGAWVDERFDKYAQVIRQAALVMKGSMGATHLAAAVARNELTSAARQLYGELGVAGVNRAKLPGQAKTVLLGGTFVLAAAGMQERQPDIMRGAYIASTVATVSTGLYYVYSFEKSYMEQTGQNCDDLSVIDILGSGLDRTLHYYYDKRCEQLGRFISAPDNTALAGA